jgi:ABC-type bacteriocin/lantibiotic exporter with double-glycine peptidase domain
MMDTISDRDVFDLNQLRPLFAAEGSRASLVRLLRQAEAMGYATAIAAPNWDELKRERGPVITRVMKDDSWDDYVLLQGIVGDEVVLVDGELRVRRLSRQEFDQIWTGWVVILRRRVESAGA